MIKPNDFDTAKAWGESSTLPAGGYVCKIIGVEEMYSKKNRPMIKIALDIAEGEHKDRFMEMFRNSSKEYAKWPNSALVYQLTQTIDGNTHGKFKQFINCVCDSNNGFEPSWGDAFGAGFKNRLVGVLFGREQWRTDDGELKWSCKPKFFKTIEEIRNGEFKVPDDEYLKDSEPATQSAPSSGFGPVKNDDIPF